MIELKAEHLQKIAHDLGHEIQPFPFDGNYHHFSVDKRSKKPLWAVGRMWDYKNNWYYIVQYGDFRGGSKFSLASYDVKEQTPQFRKAHNEIQKEIEEKAARIRAEKRQEGIDKWKPRYYDCKPDTAVSEYLKKKGLESNYRGRVNYRNTLLIPVETYHEDDGITFEGVQMIFRDEETGSWKKVFNEGLIKKGAFTRVTEFDIGKTEIVYLAEGYATACSVFASTSTSTICAFDSGNLTFVIEVLKKINPDIKIIIAADDDFQTVINGRQVNVGINAALYCQKKHQNVTYRKPIFKSRVDETDFNDLHILEGLDVVRDQLKINRAEFTDIILLGHVDHHDFYYLSTQSKTIVKLSAPQHDGKYLVSLATEKYWMEKYGSRKDKNGNDLPDWTKIRDTLLERQRDIGPFDLKKMRGLGVWEDEERIFVNHGSGVYSSQRGHSLSNIDPHLGTKNFYKNAPSDNLNFDDELTDSECLDIIRAFQLLRFKNDYDYFYVVGFIAMANIFQALDWRPHLWISAKAGSGKSWTLKQISNLIHYKLKVKDSSAAGIKQRLSHDAAMVIYDEAEPHMKHIPDVIDYARQCSTKNNDQILRGTADGEALSWEANACFLMGSITVPKFRKEDDSRFFIVEMESLDGQSPEEMNMIEDAFEKIEKHGKRLLVRMVKNFATLEKNIKLCRKFLRLKNVGAREADQMATVMAGFIMLNTKAVVTQQIFDEVWNTVQLDQSDYMQRNEADNTADDAALALFNLILDRPTGRTVKACVEAFKEGRNHFPELDSIGCELIQEKDGIKLFVAATNANLDLRMEQVGIKNFRQLIKRSEFYVASIVRRSKIFSGGQRRGYLVRVTL
jgi:putative DNA primase/helicase